MQFVGHTNSTVNFKVAEYDGRRVFVETNCQFPNLSSNGKTVNVIDLNRIMPKFDSDSEEEEESCSTRANESESNGSKEEPDDKKEFFVK